MLAILVAGIAVRMVLHGELAVRGLHIGLARTSHQTQDFVVVSLCHHRHASPSCPAADRGAVRIRLIHARKQMARRCCVGPSLFTVYRP